MISARVLGDIHACVSDPNDVLGSEGVHGKAGDSEAAGDLVLLQHGVGSQPKPQPLRQNLCLLHARLGHQNDELVSTIAGHYVRLTALLLQQAPDSCQN